jgi:hypothetical protein
VTRQFIASWNCEVGLGVIQQEPRSHRNPGVGNPLRAAPVASREQQNQYTTDLVALQQRHLRLTAPGAPRQVADPWLLQPRWRASGTSRGCLSNCDRRSEPDECEPNPLTSGQGRGLNAQEVPVLNVALSTSTLIIRRNSGACLKSHYSSEENGSRRCLRGSALSLPKGARRQRISSLPA